MSIEPLPMPPTLEKLLELLEHQLSLLDAWVYPRMVYKSQDEEPPTE